MSKQVSFKQQHVSGPPRDQSWVWHSWDLKTSWAWRLRSINLIRLIERLELEHMAHAGKGNGRLAVSYSQFVDWGIPRKCIKKAIDEGVSLGLLWVEPGVRIKGIPNRFTLTYYATATGNAFGAIEWRAPTDDWRRHENKISSSQRGTKPTPKREFSMLKAGSIDVENPDTTLVPKGEHTSILRSPRGRVALRSGALAVPGNGEIPSPCTVAVGSASQPVALQSPASPYRESSTGNTPLMISAPAPECSITAASRRSAREAPRPDFGPSAEPPKTFVSGPSGVLGGSTMPPPEIDNPREAIVSGEPSVLNPEPTTAGLEAIDLGSNGLIVNDAEAALPANFELNDQQHKSAPTDEMGPPPVGMEVWPSRIEMWRTYRMWHIAWGPMPGQPGFRGSCAGQENETVVVRLPG